MTETLHAMGTSGAVHYELLREEGKYFMGQCENLPWGTSGLRLHFGLCHGWSRRIIEEVWAG